MSDFATYRDATDDLLMEVAGFSGLDGLLKAERVLTERLFEPEFTAVLDATPAGIDEAFRGLLREVRRFRPNDRSSAGDLAALIRIYLLSQIETVWWGHIPPWDTDGEVIGSVHLVDLDALRRRGLLGFRYRRQATTLPTRAVRAAERRVWPDRYPRTAGLRIARARPEAVVLLNQVSAEFVAATPAGTPPLWVTSLARSVEHQHRLRELGYSAMLPSAHCVGYAMDVEMSWYRRIGVHGGLERALLDRQDAGQVNVIDEGQAWHVCLSPTGAGELRRGLDD